MQEKGYAFEDEECDLEVRSAAVAVWDFSNKVIAAVGIVAPASRLTDAKILQGDVIRQLKEAGEMLSSKLGFSAASTVK
ncbi:MAG TPA: hypothetical protein DCS42_04890 [Nitrospiraceae bacterium]|nr:hypothetical protein [Nitrospiraceae bacterium]